MQRSSLPVRANVLGALILSVLLLPASAQDFCTDKTSCSDCVAGTQPGNPANCFWSQPPSSTVLSGSCVNISTFQAKALTSPANAGYSYCPSTSSCDGLSLPSCFDTFNPASTTSCDWLAPFTDITAAPSSNICSSGFCAKYRAVVPPVNFGSTVGQSGQTFSFRCPVSQVGGLTPLAIGLIIAGAALLVILPLIIFRTRLIGLCCTKRSTVFSGEQSTFKLTPLAVIDK
jgi:hypothetical protein